MPSSRALILTLLHHYTIWDIFIQWDRVVQFLHMTVLTPWKISRRSMARWSALGITLLNQLMLRSSWEEHQVSLERRLWEFNNWVWLQMKRSITLILSSTTVLMSSMKVTKPTSPDKSSPTLRERRLRFFGPLLHMMKWLPWSSETPLFGRCTKTLGIQFPVSCQSEFILIMISVFHTPSSSTKWTPEFITWWLRIKCSALKMLESSQLRRTHIAPNRSGDHKRIFVRKSNSVIQTGTQKILITTFTIRATTPENPPTKLLKNTIE